ncbi:hypothetical protein Dimus_023926 [Dionaea muscipula]
MEASAAASLSIVHGAGHAVLKQEKRSNYGHVSNTTDHHHHQDQATDHQHTLKRGSVDKDVEDGSSSSKPLSYAQKELLGDELESAKVEMGEVMEENQRLRSYLQEIMKDYQALQMKFNEFARQESKSSTPPTNTNAGAAATTTVLRQADHDEADLVSLRLGRSSSMDKSNLSTSAAEKGKEPSGGAETAVLNSSTENSFDEPKDEQPGVETWPPASSKLLKNVRTGDDDDAAHQPPLKKTRVSVRARCDAPTMNDGCQWRKYGQKIAKGNPCPRAYYRCTVAPSCPVRKQVQRCVEDMSILITTYEGTHNHPLPVAATAMASTTSAAAHMLMSGSSYSAGSTAPTTSVVGELHGNGNGNGSRSSRVPFFLPAATTSFSVPSTSHPTITLDLTASSTSQFNRPAISSSILSSFSSPGCSWFPSTSNLTFNSSDQLTTSTTSTPPAITNWPNGKLLGYNSQPYNHHQAVESSINNWRINGTISNPNPPLFPADTISAAAARALTSDPSFHSVLTAALSSFISAGAGGGAGGGGGGDRCNSTSFAQKLKWGTTTTTTEATSSVNYSSAGNSAAASALSKGNNGCGSSFLGIAPNSTNPAGSLMSFLSSPLPFSTSSKTSSASPAGGDDKAQTS